MKVAAGPVLAVLSGWALWPDQTPLLCITAAIGVWMAVWWITEAVSIYVTALLPVILFPLSGVMDMKTVAPLYLPHINFLFMGGFMLAFALEKWNLHQRIALRIILDTGATPSRILLGFMLASYGLSMWMFNTATVMMLLPALLAVIAQLESRGNSERVAVPYLLGLAFASSIGGTATLIGTAPNLVFLEYFNSNFGQENPVTFGNWFAFGLPVSALFFGLCYLVLNRMFFRGMKGAAIDLEYCRTAYQKLGKLTFEEKTLSLVMATTILLWFTAKDLNLGSFTLPGWADHLPWLASKGMVKESTIAMAMAFLLFLIPARNRPKEHLLQWKDLQRMPYGLLFLFGGGFALAKGVAISGLGDWMGGQLVVFADWPTWLLVGSLCLFMTFFTELTSNTASTVLMMPILGALSNSVEASPLLILLPVTFSASFAFMLPVATPPNTIVFGSERLTVRDMIGPGLRLNLIGVMLITTMALTYGAWLFGL